jgi:hypothetical protein
MPYREAFMNNVVVPLSTPQNNHILFGSAFVGLMIMACIENRPTRLCMAGGLLGFGIMVRQQTVEIVKDNTERHMVSAAIIRSAMRQAAQSSVDHVQPRHVNGPDRQ